MDLLLALIIFLLSAQLCLMIVGLAIYTADFKVRTSQINEIANALHSIEIATSDTFTIMDMRND